MSALHADPALAHELRTPLHGVLASVALLLETSLSAEQREHVETIRDAAGALLVLADDSLGISAAPDDRCDVRRIANGVARLLDAGARALGIAIRVDVADDVPSFVAASPSRVRQVLVNLVGNAIKHGARRAIAIRVERDGDQLRVSVADDGPGVAAGVRARLFAPLPAASRDVPNGSSGLGLAISADVVHALGGTIGVDDGARGGSVFWFMLPCPERERVPRAVLVVDDDPVARHVTARMIERLGGTACTVASVAESRDALANDDFDVVLADWHLADGTGADVVVAARATARNGYTPVVALTGSAEPTTREWCLAAGMYACELKPLSLDALAAALVRHARAQRSHVDALLDATRVDALARLEASAPGLLARVAADYAHTATTQLAGLEAAIAAGDATAAARAAHAIRGSSASAGAARAATLAAAIERVATYAAEREPGDLPGAVDAVEALRAAVTAAAEALRLVGLTPAP